MTRIPDLKSAEAAKLPAESPDESIIRIHVNISEAQAQSLEQIRGARNHTIDQVMSAALDRISNFEEMQDDGQRFFVEKRLSLSWLRRVARRPTHRRAAQFFYLPPGSNYWEKERIIRRSSS